MKYFSRSLATVVVASLFSGATVVSAEGSSSSPEIPPSLMGIIGIGTPSPQGIIGIGTPSPQGIIGIGKQGIIGIGVEGIIGIGEPGVQGIIGIGTQGIIGIGVDGGEQTLGIIGIGEPDATLGIIGIGVDGNAEPLGIIGIGGEEGEDAATLGIIGIGEEDSTEGIIGIGDPVELDGTSGTRGIIGIGFQSYSASHLALGVSASDTVLMLAGTKYAAAGNTIARGTSVLLFGQRDALGLIGDAWIAVPFVACAGDPAMMAALTIDATASVDLWLPAGATSAEVCGFEFDFGGDTSPAAGLYRVEGSRSGDGFAVTGLFRID